MQCVIVLLGVIVRAIDNALADCFDFCPGPHGDECEPCAPIKHGFFPSFIVDHDFNKTCAFELCGRANLESRAATSTSAVRSRALHALTPAARPGCLSGVRGMRRRRVPRRGHSARACPARAVAAVSPHSSLPVRPSPPPLLTCARAAATGPAASAALTATTTACAASSRRTAVAARVFARAPRRVAAAAAAAAAMTARPSFFFCS